MATSLILSKGNAVYAVYATESSATSFSLAIYGDTLPAQINHEMLRMFREFRERGAITETFYYRITQDTTPHNPERWRQLLEEYARALEDGEDPLVHDDFLDLLTEEADAFIQEQSEEEKTTYDAQALREQQPATDTQQEQEPVVVKQTEEVIAEIYHAAPKNGQDMVRYHIQIAASSLPLSQQQLRNIYHGEKEIHHFTEDQWEKYYIGHYRRFSDAREKLRTLNIEGAFIIAYVLDQKHVAYRARQIERVFASTSLQTFHHDEQDQFRVQIAASSSPLSMNELYRIYPDTTEVAIIYEDKWFKYSIPGAETLTQSWRIARETRVDGAFVVRYRKGRPLPLRN